MARFVLCDLPIVRGGLFLFREVYLLSRSGLEILRFAQDDKKCIPDAASCHCAEGPVVVILRAQPEGSLS